jgi:hypothetical protein
MTPLNMAVASCQSFFVKALLDAGADPSIPDDVDLLLMKANYRFIMRLRWEMRKL